MKGLIYVVTTCLIFNHLAPAIAEKDWWRSTIIYEVYIRSFKDSNGDGIGDIKGVTLMLDHFVDLGIETLWLSPFCVSPMKDMGYDVSNYTDIEPLFGTWEDFNELAREAKKRGLKLMMDLVINHSSDQHEWFVKSEKVIEPYDNYYIWQDAKGERNGTRIPPSNWISVFRGSAWQWSDIRKQFYLHQFAVAQPDFNLRDATLKKELKKIMKFWLDRGISGFRLDATPYLMEDEQLRDEPPNPEFNPDAYERLLHIYTKDLPENYDLIHELREYLDTNYNQGDDDERILVVEAYTSMKHTMEYYGRENYSVVHFPFNFGFTMDLKTFPNAYKLDRIIKGWLTNMPPGSVANWVAENHDNPRLGSRLNEEFCDIVNTAMLMLPGVPCFYYGQEIGMTDNELRPDQLTDPLNGRDPERLPMQWDDSLNAGFSTNHKTWLPTHPNYWRVNVEAQKHQKISRYQMFKTLSGLRKTVTGRLGVFKSYILSPFVYAFTRSYPGQPTYVTIFNLGTEMEMVDLHLQIPHLPRYLTVITSSLNSGYTNGKKIRSRPMLPLLVSMRPTSSVVFSTL